MNTTIRLELFVTMDLAIIVLKLLVFNYMEALILFPTLMAMLVIMIISGLMMYNVMEMKSLLLNVLIALGVFIIVTLILNVFNCIALLVDQVL